jgi:Retroviral aspartyl protease
MIIHGEDSEAFTRTIIRCNNDTDKVIIRAMSEAPEPTRAYRSSMRRPIGTMTRPIRVNDEDLCLAAYVTINGVKAYTLFDSGSTTDAVSPDFTRVANVPIYELEKPLTLQLGCAGSRSKINFGTESQIEFGSIANNTYLDVANLDKYDSILGREFLRKHGIMLDFNHNEIVIHSKQRIAALPKGEGAAVANNSPRKMKKGT